MTGAYPLLETMVSESVNEKKIKEVCIWAGVLHKDKFKSKGMHAGQSKVKAAELLVLFHRAKQLIVICLASNWSGVVAKPCA